MVSRRQTFSLVLGRLGEYQLYVMPYDDPSAARHLTQFIDGYPENLSWAPDSEGLYFTTEKRELWFAHTANGTSRKVLQTPYNALPELRHFSRREVDHLRYAGREPDECGVYLYNVDDNISYPVTSPWYDSVQGSSPLTANTFLYFLQRLQGLLQSGGMECLYNLSSYVFVIPLSADTRSHRPEGR